MDDEQARLREELRVKQEQETSTVSEEEQEDAVIDAITDPYALHLTQLKIENDMQKEAGAIQQNAYDRRVSGYGTIENKLQVLVKKKADLVSKRKQFAGTKYDSSERRYVAEKWSTTNTFVTWTEYVDPLLTLF